MNGEKEKYKKEYRRITVRTTDGSTLVGNINIGINQRVSDLFTKKENPFIVLSDADHSNVSGKVLFVNTSNIVWVEPED